MAATISTRILIISDTHGSDHALPDIDVDVAIHCGDLTEESKIVEFEQALELMKAIRAPLKLVIAGNHDFTMDIPTFKRKIAAVEPLLEESLERKEYGDCGEAKALFTCSDAQAAGIVFLDEGMHAFTLSNGASLTVYASPYTSGTSEWGFQFAPSEGHGWNIEDNTDIAITHSPPRGMFDYTDDRQRAGMPELFSAVAKARPLLHCFGHIHGSYGAKQVTWRAIDAEAGETTHFTAIDNEESTVIETLASLKPGKFDDEDTLREEQERLGHYTRQGFISAAEKTGSPRRGEQTLFVNAALDGTEGDPVHLPWIVDLGLRRASVEPCGRDCSHDKRNCRADGELTSHGGEPGRKRDAIRQSEACSPRRRQESENYAGTKEGRERKRRCQ